MKIAYFIHVPWKWIKQRPHFIAEELSNFYDVQVLERWPFSKKFRGGKSECVRVQSYFQFPKDRWGLVHAINSIIQKFTINGILKSSDFIWITNPLQYSYINKSKVKGKIIYDCMDDLIEFLPSAKRQSQFLKLEERLIKEADIVFASSNYLKTKLKTRYGDRKIYIVNNGIKNSVEIRDAELSGSVKAILGDPFFHIVYIGTISSWFDFELMVEVLDNNPSAELVLFGPTDIRIPSHERIKYCGRISHDEVFSVMKHSQLLIMPFIVSELIRSVNPVKLYEYIYSGTKCMAPYYEESAPFEDYVYLYKNKKECCDEISRIIKGAVSKPHSLIECQNYAMENTWSSRVEYIHSILTIQ